MSKITALPLHPTEDVDGTETLPIVVNGEMRRIPAAPLVDQLAQPSVGLATQQAALAQAAAATARAVANFKENLDAAISDFVVDQPFTTTDPAVQLLGGGINADGLNRACIRTATPPFYTHLGTGADPSSKADVDARRRQYPTVEAARVSSEVLPVGSLFGTAGGVFVGDGGATDWVVVADEPGHPGKIALQGGRWAEIIGPYLPVEAFGALGDCPDVSGLDEATQQPAIIAAITAATNDVQAFQDAFKTAHAIGGGVVTYGHGKVYRIGFSHLGVHALVMGSNTTLERVGGGWLEFDPTGITGEKPSYTGLPPRRGWPDPGITCGEPETGLAPSFTLVAGTANVVDGGQGVSEADFYRNCHAVDVDIRSHIRTYWHSLADQSVPTYRRLRMYGLNLRWVIGASYRNCYVRGVPSNGIHASGRDWHIEGCTAELCGYGAVLGTAQNNITAWGYVIVGRPDLSGEAYYIDNCTSRYAKDEGLSYGGVKGMFVSKFTAIGDHDRAVEGDESFATSETSSSIGQELNGDTIVDDVYQDGLHIISSGSITAGSNQLQMADAYFLSADGSNGRYIFVPGAGPGGGAGPFLISSVDYSTNIVTLATNASASVSNVMCYIKSRVAVTASDANQTRQTLRHLRIRNVYSLYHPVSLITRANGRLTVEDVEMESVTVPANFHGVSVEGEYATAKNIRYIGCTAASNSAAVRVKGKVAKVDGVYADVGFAYGVRAAEFGGVDAKRLLITGLDIDGLTASPIRLDYTMKCALIVIDGNRVLGANSAGATDEAFLRIGVSTFSADDIIVTRNFARFSGATIGLIKATGGNLAASAIGRMRVEQNDFYSPKTLIFTISGTPANARCWLGATTPFGILIDQYNSIPGQRVLNTAAYPPTSGRWFAGDEVRSDYPAAAAVDSARVTVGGNFDTLYAADGATAVTVNGAVTAAATVVVTDATNIWANDTVVFSGPQTRRVISVDYATKTLALSSAITVAHGSSVANAAPTFKAKSTLAA